MEQPQVERREAERKPEGHNAGSLSSWEANCRCRVIQLIDDTILAVRPPPGMKCSYKMRYQDVFLCTSAARKEIYKRSQA